MTTLDDTLSLAADPTTAPEVLAGLCHSSDVDVQRAVAINPGASIELLQHLWETHPDCVLENPILTLWEFSRTGSVAEMIGWKALLSVYNHLRDAGNPLPGFVFNERTLLEMGERAISRLDADVFRHLPFEASENLRFRLIEYPARRRLFDIFCLYAPDRVWNSYARDQDSDVRREFANLLRSARQKTPPDRLAIYQDSVRALAQDESFEMWIHLANCRFLPPDLVVRLAGSQDWRIREGLARCVFAPMRVRKSLAKDCEEQVRLAMARNSEDPEIHRILINDPSLEVRRTLAESLNVNRETLGCFKVDDKPEVVKAVFKNPAADTPLRIEIITHAVPQVQEMVCRMGKSLTVSFYRAIKEVVSGDVLAHLAVSPGLHRTILEDLALDPRPEVRLGVARRLSQRQNAGANQKNVALVNALAVDPSSIVRERICADRRLNRASTEFLFSDPDPRVRKKTLCAVLESLADSRAARRFDEYRAIYREKSALITRMTADRDHLIRHAIATSPEAPPSALGILFDDRVDYIREAARACEGWPFGVVIDLEELPAHKFHGCSIAQGKTTPSAAALKVLADSQNPFLRNLVAGCKRTSATILRKLAGDSHATVRRTAQANVKAR